MAALSMRGTMTVIYFTDGALIEDEAIRRALLRIPEVLEVIRKTQSEFIEHDLYMVMNSVDAYEKLNQTQKRHLKNLLQRALFERWKKTKSKYDLVVRRNDYASFEQAREVFTRLAMMENLKVLTIGPGFDDLESFLRSHLEVKSVPLFDIIQIDPQLDWFWSDYKNSIQLHS